jgi:hypothetical protein
MSVTALEIRLNGEILYVVGMPGWQMLGANVSGHKYTAEIAAQIRSQVGSSIAGMPDEGVEALSLTCFVGLPDPEIPGGSTGQNYGTQALAVGDEITIRVIETDNPDLPLPPSDSEYNVRIDNSDSGDEPE